VEATPGENSEAVNESAQWLLPERARLLHIGIPKTGTTALQQAASSRRAQLLNSNVRYPTRFVNHRDAVSGLMGRRWGWSGLGSSIPPRSAWDALMAEIEADTTRRTLISHEFGSEADDETAREFVSELGPSTHIVITLRAVGAILPSAWQQYIKTGYVGALDTWLKAVIGDTPKLSVTPSYHRRNDQGGVVKRWAAAAGPQNVTVVVLDKDRPHLLYDAFEGMLGLPEGMLRDESSSGFRANRGMSLSESELIRNFNVLIKGRRVNWDDYHSLIRLGGAARLLEERVPAEGEPPVRLPAWAAERAIELGKRYAADIAESGVRVIGDLNQLYLPVTPRDEDATDRVADVPLDIAVQTLGGVFSAATGRGATFAELVADGGETSSSARALVRTANMPTSRVSTADLVRVLGGRIVRKGQDIRRDRQRRKRNTSAGQNIQREAE
jgi:hypothetical protein